MNSSEIKTYKTEDGNTSIEVNLDNDTVWLNKYQLVHFLQQFKNAIISLINKNN